MWCKRNAKAQMHPGKILGNASGLFVCANKVRILHNSASLRFIHRDQLESGGYGECLKLFTQEAAQALLQ